MQRKTKISKKGVVADFLTIIFSLLLLVIFMIIAYYFLTPQTINKAEFSGDQVDIEAELFLANILKTSTPSGTGLDTITTFINNIPRIGEEQAKKKALKELLPNNPLRFYVADWIIEITEGDLTRGIISTRENPPTTWGIENPIYQAYGIVYENEAGPVFGPARGDRNKYYQKAMPIVITTGGKSYTLITYLSTDYRISRIIPEIVQPRKGLPSVKGERVVTELEYYPTRISDGTLCPNVVICESYIAEQDCQNDPCYASKKFDGCSYTAGRCVER